MSGADWVGTQPRPLRTSFGDYGRYFIGERYAGNFADGLLALESNWHGSAVTNSSIEATLTHFQRMETNASPADLKNWRFQQALFRAHDDAHVRRRLIHETDIEERALRSLQSAASSGSVAAIARAEDVLSEPLNDPLAHQWCIRIFQLAEALFQSIGMQLSVDHYRAIAVDRGASLDTLEYPLNNRLWLKARFNHIRQLSNESARIQALAEIVHWTDPGPGGYYDDIGNIALQPHLVPGLAFNEDPERMASTRVDFEEDLVVDEPDEKPDVARRVSWIDHVESLYDTPLQMRYTGLDPGAQYKLRVVYGGDNFKRKMRLVANKEVEIHPYLLRPFPIRPMEFSVPKSATASGELYLSWFGEPGLGGNGRNCQVSEVWLLKQSASNP